MNNKDAIAFGAPGIEPRWTSSAKNGVGPAYHSSSRVTDIQAETVRREKLHGFRHT